MSVRLLVSGTYVSVVWFNQAYLKDKVRQNQTIVVSGKWDASRSQVTADRTIFNEIEQKEYIGRYQPVYSTTGSISLTWLKKHIYQAFVQYGQYIEEILPTDIISKYKLLPRARAMYFLHFPKQTAEQTQARRRMVYEELFLYECKIFWLRRMHQSKNRGIEHHFKNEQVLGFVNQFEFPLTSAQERVIAEILKDMISPVQMNRLIQGDVGSGKTLVASVSLYANYISGFQGAVMVPTEILAEQHSLSLQKYFFSYGVNVVTLTGTMTAKNRKEVLASIAEGTAHIIVGTHALIQDPVVYDKLGLVIIDEQHRFGVRQRQKLREKGEMPDVLFMTATPIPRTLAITVFGEMDVSTIDEMPKGRVPIKTHWVKKDLWPKVIQSIKQECEKRRQVYVVCPLIEESEKLDLQNTQEIYNELIGELNSFQIGLLHGRMSSQEKEDVMTRFSNNDVHVLVSTTVIEVGVNVVNATCIVIYDADRFGLAQLHQLRGRVGRGGGASSCILVANPKSEGGVERMRIMTETVDGFEISRRDLQLRGPGDFLGMKQSGLPEFKIADLTEDFKVLEIARSDAQKLFSDEKYDEGIEYQLLRDYLQEEDYKSKLLD